MSVVRTSRGEETENDGEPAGRSAPNEAADGTGGSLAAAVSGVKTNGRAAVQRVYNGVLRERLPRKLGNLNGVTVQQPRLFDASDVQPDYEKPAVDCLKAHARSDDRVVVVGGGWGVTSVWASRVADSVVTYEASARQYEECRETLRLNPHHGEIDLRHAVVGENVDPWGEMRGADVVDPCDLPECDLLELDCEGAELGIVRGLAIRPRVVSVEYHPHLGMTEAEIREALAEKGYRVTEKAVEARSEAEGVYVLTAVHERAD